MRELKNSFFLSCSEGIFVKFNIFFIKKKLESVFDTGALQTSYQHLRVNVLYLGMFTTLTILIILLFIQFYRMTLMFHKIRSKQTVLENIEVDTLNSVCLKERVK